MMRNSKTPTLVILFLLGVIGVVIYNYWSLSQRNLRIKEALFLSEEKINELSDKKAYADKQMGLTSERVNRLEKELDAQKTIVEQKGKDIDDLNSMLKKKDQEKNSLALEITELKENLKKSQGEMVTVTALLDAKIAEFNTMSEKYKQDLELAKKDTSICAPIIESNMNEYKSHLVSIVGSQFNRYEADKMKSIIMAKNAPFTNIGANSLNLDQPGVNLPKVEPLVNNDKQNQIQQLQQPVNLANLNDRPSSDKILTEMRGKREVTESENTNCQSPKDFGDNCGDSTLEPVERYYFDIESKTCLSFMYKGCNGNTNNFNILDNCKSTCL